MSDFYLIMDIVNQVLSYPLYIFGFTLTLGSVVLGTIILSIAIGFVVSLFGGD